ncbi:MAG TPA: hypothetical protein ENK43_03650 [Planctomycetes bacterium]|nr:hypothetical protein [Planctomycetota bacterium]
MSQTTLSHLAIDRLRGQRRVLSEVSLMAAGATLLWASSWARIQLPFTPVPFTLQTLVVVLLGMTLGMRRGVGAAVLYVVASFAAPDVFLASARLTLTGGYLLGFVGAAALTGFLFERGWGTRWSLALLAMAAAQLFVLTTGVLWLSRALGSWNEAWAFGAEPFFAVEIAKILVSASLLRGTTALGQWLR